MLKVCCGAGWSGHCVGSLVVARTQVRAVQWDSAGQGRTAPLRMPLLLRQLGIYFPSAIDPTPCPQVAAYTSGRSRVSEYDCLLLRHILWQRPDEAERIYDWLLK